MTIDKERGVFGRSRGAYRIKSPFNSHGALDTLEVGIRLLQDLWMVALKRITGATIIDTTVEFIAAGQCSSQCRLSRVLLSSLRFEQSEQSDHGICRSY